LSATPEARVTACNRAPIQPDRDFVLYWMIAARRLEWNFALQRAIERARELDLPLVILEALRSGYPWASDRLHRFVIDGMTDNARRATDAPVYYYAYVERERGAGGGLLERLAQDAALVVTDDYPVFFLPKMMAAAARRLDVLMEAVDGNGLMPMRLTGEPFKTAHSFRRFLHKYLLQHLDRTPLSNPFAEGTLRRLGALPDEITNRWTNVARRLREGWQPNLGELPIDHAVGVAGVRGGASTGARLVDRFIDSGLPRYAGRNHPDDGATSGLSPYLHFGHVSSHQVFATIAEREDWDADRVDASVHGKRSGWWGMSDDAEAFLDQLVTWRELGFNMCVHRDDYDSYESLPEWARQTLEEHEDDAREHLYALQELERARSHDVVWNAAQTQLLREGTIHNYLRMLWGKKILEWSPSPRDALATMIELNNKYALDGRDPNSYSGIFWCLGRYDRPFGPERPIFGKIRYMSSENTLRKLHISEYLEEYRP